MMPHTREAWRRHRPLLLAIFVLVVATALEPSIITTGTFCADLIQNYFGAVP